MKKINTANYKTFEEITHEELTETFRNFLEILYEEDIIDFDEVEDILISFNLTSLPF